MQVHCNDRNTAERRRRRRRRRRRILGKRKSDPQADGLACDMAASNRSAC
jgi:hypothetical protein